ncbi:PaeR7I family type II restriction endonuclease [Pelomonas sp. Root1217]|uniref:PaeR7I family type II restriction endonuclease n=1 Tax=Pelomonas sp. Root1217 TaxID=1736430 RepID=UPI0009EC1060|nr:PaeR7I family type II restriction endonuclease [Pelomonas sp. Root1217]
MTVNVDGYEDCVRLAVRGFWTERAEAAAKAKAKKQAAALAAANGGMPTTSQEGKRATVISGQHLRGFEELIRLITRTNGLPNAEIMVGSQLVTLPGFFRPTKRWDVLVMNGNRLLAAFEFKSQVGSISNNYNNRTEEAIGSAHCLATAAYKGALGADLMPPFLGWLMIVDDSNESNHVPDIAETDFNVFPEFEGTSYLDRYDLFCQRLISEKLYDVAAVIATPETGGGIDGRFIDVAQVRCERASPGSKTHLGLLHFVAAFAGRVAIEAAQNPSPPPRPPRQSQIKAAMEKAAKEAEKAKKKVDRATKKAEQDIAKAAKAAVAARSQPDLF